MWPLIAVAAGIAAVWSVPGPDTAVRWVVVGLSVPAFALAAAATRSRAVRFAVVGDAAVAGLCIAGQFDATPAMVGATVILVALPVIAIIRDIRATAPPAPGSTPDSGAG